MQFGVSMFPAEYQNTMFIARKGSWNRSKPNGFDVVNVRPNAEGKGTKVTPFLTGFNEDKTAITCLLALLFTRPALAQEWTEYKSVRDGFQALFPSQPRVVETTWKSQAGFNLPARVSSLDRGREHYSVIVADYSGIEALGKERVKTCPAGAEPCLGSENLSGVGYWKHDTRGAPLYAASLFLGVVLILGYYLWP